MKATKIVFPLFFLVVGTWSSHHKGWEGIEIRMLLKGYPWQIYAHLNALKKNQVFSGSHSSEIVKEEMLIN